jgi:hypothetical protein
MSRDPYDPDQRFAYDGDEKVPPAGRPAPTSTSDAQSGAANRGTPAAPAGSGGVTGSGASAGGGGGAEDYDSDPQGGGGAMPRHPTDDRPDEGGDAPSHGSR